MAQLSIETVKQAVDILKSQGKKLTNRNIVDCLGYGSFSTLKKIREYHPALFDSGSNDTHLIADTHQVSSNLKDVRIVSLETSIQLMQQSIQLLIQDKITSTSLEKQVKELTENLQEMYQLWRELAQQLTSESNHKEVITTDVTAKNSNELPDPKQAPAFIAWAEQQKSLNYGAWAPVVMYLNQQRVFMPKGGVWNTKSLSDFIRKKRLQLSKKG